MNWKTTSPTRHRYTGTHIRGIVTTHGNEISAMYADPDEGYGGERGPAWSTPPGFESIEAAKAWVEQHDTAENIEQLRASAA